MKIVGGLDQDNLTVSNLLLDISLDIKDGADSAGERNEKLSLYDPIFSWLCNVLHEKVNDFPFHRRASADAKSWYQGMCLSSFGECDDLQRPNKRRETDSENSLHEDIENSCKTVKFITMHSSKEKSK